MATPPPDGVEGGPPNEVPVIVAIGASAGCVPALQALFDSLPGDTDASYVVIVHLDPEARSDLARILAARTRMPVVQVTGREKLHPNYVYVIAPGQRLQITDHELSAENFEQPHGQRMPIDLFFRSLADRLGDGFAVILTGAGSDGAIGVRAMKESGGIILVQDPAEAEYPSMPRSAIATGVADFVLPVRELAACLGELIQQKKSLSPVEPSGVDEELLRRILAHVRARTGHDFAKYKRSTVLRRIARRLQVTRTEDVQAYYDHLRNNAEEAQALLGDFLISVTTFFRDRETFDVLKRDVLPQIFQMKEPNDPIRVWVPGCATGEEAYTITILLLEEAARHEIRPPTQVFGSDLDSHALAVAREGRYPAAIETDIAEDRLRRFFVREGETYRVRQELRDSVLFASHNVLKDPPFSRVDLISCRNLLIYLDRELQEQVCGTLYYALNPDGFLVLGSSETADNPPGLFHSVDRAARIYQSTAHIGDKPRLLPRLLAGSTIHAQIAHAGAPRAGGTAVQDAAAHRRALESLAPPSILVDRSHRVVHLSDSAGRYIQPSGGQLSGDVVDLVRSELRFELRSALHRAFEQRLGTLSLPILVRFNGASHRVHVQVKPPIAEGRSKQPHAVVLFIEGEEVDAGHPSASQQQATDQTVRRLTQELELTQARLRTMREESESANEELRAANEELQSINEEYRSTSEELETSKEELQSINEELQTVNSELKLKLEAVSRAHNDLQNLMTANEIGTLFLDPNLRIKRFTEHITDLFSLAPSDEGRPITDFAHRLEYDDLVKDARTVLAELVPIRREVHSRDERWYEVRLRPYRTVDDKIDGVVITFLDVSERRGIEERLGENERLLQQQKRLIDLSRDPIFVWDFDGGIAEWNRGSEDLYGYRRAEALGKPKEQLLRTVVPGSSFAELKAKLLADGSWSGELTHKTKDGRSLTVESRLLMEKFEDRRLVLESTRDVTGRNLLEARQRLLLNELAHRVKNTLAVVQSIAHQTMRASGSNAEFMESFDGRLAALASAHALLVQSEWKGADLATLARRQLKAYAGDGRARMRIEGEPIALPPDLATPFGLVLHELATNAVKHGALSHPDGTVELRWAVAARNGARILNLIWHEKGGKPSASPRGKGFGTALIEHGIPKATVAREFPHDGFICTVEVPLPHGD